MTGGGGNREDVVSDEMQIISSEIGIAGRRVADIGCGSGAFACRLAIEGSAASVVGFDVPGALPKRDGATPDIVRFLPGKAQDLPLEDDEIDLAFMMKSLHHVPGDQMDAALEEIARVLVPDGILYVSEPVAEGGFQDIIHNFHDETEVRRQAQAALDRCKVLVRERDIHFLAPCRYRDFEDFERRMMHSATVTTEITDAIHAATREAYARHADKDGSFSENRPFHVTVLRKPLG